MKRILSHSLLFLAIITFFYSCSDSFDDARIKSDPLDYPIDAYVEIKTLNVNGIGTVSTIQFDPAISGIYWMDVYQFRSSGNFEIILNKIDPKRTMVDVYRLSHPSELFLVYSLALGVTGRVDPNGYFYRSNVIVIPEHD